MNNNEQQKHKKVSDFLRYSYSVKDVRQGVEYWQTYLLSRVQNLFLYEDLPETLPAWEIEKNLIIKGNGCVVKKNGNLYIPFEGSVYGYDVYRIPNKFTFGNPVIGGGFGLEDRKNCAILWNTDIDKTIPNNSILWPTIQRYARMLADLESTFTNSMIYDRAGLLAQAQNEKAAQAYDRIIKKLEVGDVNTVSNATLKLESIQSFNFKPNNQYTQYCETRDYLINCFFNSIGLQTLEEKKERMVVDEVENPADADILKNNIDIMYKCRLENVEKINKVFGTNIKVYKNVITEV
jgi:hypothetical protein